MVDVNVTPFEVETTARHGDLVRADVADTYHHDAQHPSRLRLHERPRQAQP